MEGGCERRDENGERRTRRREKGKRRAHIELLAPRFLVEVLIAWLKLFEL